MRVFVTTRCSPHDRRTLAVVRSLGRAGAQVTVGADRALCQAFYSRYCRRRVRLPDPAADAPAFERALLRAVAGHDVLMPVCDYSVRAVVRRREAFARSVPVAVPDLATLEEAADKQRLLERARSLGIAVPETHCPATAAQARDLAAGLGYPCILKPRRGAGGFGFRIVRSASELVRAYGEAVAHRDAVFDAHRPLLQAYVPGRVHDVCLLCRAGEPRAALTQRRLRMYPRAGGVGIDNETTHEPDLLDQAGALVRALGWHGLAQVEFKRDARDGRPKLMELNPRCWGTIALAVAAGVDFPVLTCRLALDGDVAPVFSYPAGLRFRWPLPYAVLYAKRSRRRWRSLRALLARRADTRSDLRPDDPLPHAVELLVTGLRLWLRRG